MGIVIGPAGAADTCRTGRVDRFDLFTGATGGRHHVPGKRV
jgi:hypothetical protein